VAFAGAGVRVTTKMEGDLHPDTDPAVLRARQRAVVDRPWAWVRQGHGARVLTVDAASLGAVSGSEADALVTADPAIALSVRVADCVPVALASAGGPVGVVHAGWRGLAAGVVEAAAVALRDLGGTDLSARIGPCIEGACYEFGPERDLLEERYGSVVGCMTRWGTPGLDLAAAVRAACRRAGIEVVGGPSACTACEAGTYWSHRARGEAGRQAMVVWRLDGGPSGRGSGEGGPSGRGSGEGGPSGRGSGEGGPA
jgi:YfiH family protein